VSFKAAPSIIVFTLLHGCFRPTNRSSCLRGQNCPTRVPS